LVEQRTENPRVAGSIPAMATIYYSAVSQVIPTLLGKRLISRIYRSKPIRHYPNAQRRANPRRQTLYKGLQAV
jgi:hypothetical protein